MSVKLRRVLVCSFVFVFLFVLFTVSASADSGEYYRPTDRFPLGEIYAEGKASSGSAQNVGCSYDGTKGTMTLISSGLNQESKYDYLYRYMSSGSAIAQDGYYDVNIYSTIDWAMGIDVPLIGSYSTMCLYLPFCFSANVSSVPLPLADRFNCTFTYQEAFSPALSFEVKATWVDKDFIGVDFPIEGYFYAEVIANRNHSTVSSSEITPSPIIFQGFDIQIMTGDGTVVSPVYACALGNVTVQGVSKSLSDSPIYPLPNWDGVFDYFDTEEDVNGLMGDIGTDLDSFNTGSFNFMNAFSGTFSAIGKLFSQCIMPSGSRLNGIVTVCVSIGLFGALLGAGVYVYKNRKKGDDD